LTLNNKDHPEERKRDRRITREKSDAENAKKY
jgi:hypothetical protein